MNTNQLQIAYQDDDLIAFSKPDGMVTNDAASVSGVTLQTYFREQFLEKGDLQSQIADEKWWQELVPADFDDQYGTPREIFEQRQGMVHRLDKDTSGIVLFAKNPGSLVALLAQFRDRTVAKTYTCLVHGTFGLQRDVINAPIGRSRRDRKKFAVASSGRPAVTEYEVKEQFSDFTEEAQASLVEDDSDWLRQAARSYQGFSLVQCFPKTGRTHQIRVHLAHIQHPLVGDHIYSGRKRARLDLAWCQRHFLHASQLRFTHPRTGEILEIEDQLPADLQHVLAKLAK